MSVTTHRTNDMRQRADWMVPSDDAVLELIRDYGNLTPTAIDALGGPVADHAGDRCRELAKHGMLELVYRGLYRLTERGHAYLDEELDAAELERHDEIMSIAERLAAEQSDDA